MSKTIEEAEAALASAKSAYRSELEQDCNRSEGSGAQERRREEHQQSLRDDICRCERDLDESKRNASDPEEMTVEQMHARISLLSDEINANEEENRMCQEEITALYAKIDARKA